MAPQPDVHDVAAALRVSIGLCIRQLQQMKAEGDLSVPESSALKYLDHLGPTTVTALARTERISVQSMGVTLRGLEARGLVERRPDPDDGRSVELSLTGAGQEMLRNRRGARTEQLAQALSAGFTPGEIEQLGEAAALIERLALSL
jgi:DNA-binding MarR family transcriptional regulator